MPRKSTAKKTAGKAKKATKAKKARGAKKSTTKKAGRKVAAKKAVKKSAKKKTAKKATKKSITKARPARKARPKKAAAAKKTVAKKASKKTAVKAAAKKAKPKPVKKAAAPVKRASAARARRRSKAKASQPAVQLPPPPQVDNPKLQRKELNQLKKVLMQEHKRLAQEILDIQRVSISDESEEGRNDREGYSIHMAETASDYQMVELALLQNSVETQQLQMIEESLYKLEHKTYGVCERCTANIGYERLKAKPYARLCIVCRNAIERGLT